MTMLCRQYMARLGLFMLLFLSGVAPLHLVEEVHALSPASATHHAVLHCDEKQGCVQPDDNVAQPLSGQQHERHHEAQCAKDKALSYAHFVEAVKVAPSHIVLTLLDFAPVEVPFCLPFAPSELRGRAPPSTNDTLPLQPSRAFYSGRAPPVLA